MKLPPPMNPVAEGDAKIEVAEAVAPTDDDVQTHQSSPTHPVDPQPLRIVVWRIGWPLLSMIFLPLEQRFMRHLSAT